MTKVDKFTPIFDVATNIEGPILQVDVATNTTSLILRVNVACGAISLISRLDVATSTGLCERMCGCYSWNKGGTWPKEDVVLCEKTL